MFLLLLLYYFFLQPCLLNLSCTIWEFSTNQPRTKKMGNRMWCLVSLIPFDSHWELAGLGDRLRQEGLSLRRGRQMVRGGVNDEMKCFSVWLDN